ncbi:MAG: hypothetical protein QM724_02805 [Flavobacteriales bacterium]
MRHARHTLPAMLILLGLSLAASGTVRTRTTDARVSHAATATAAMDTRALNDADVFRYHPKKG